MSGFPGFARLAVLLAAATVAGLLFWVGQFSPRTSLSIQPVTEARLLAADASPGDWLSYGRNHANHRFSPLTQIDRRNVAGLRPVWHYWPRRFALGAYRTESTPIALDGMLIYSDYKNAVIALDARTGRTVWRHVHKNGPTAVCCGLVNRGVAAYSDKVYLAALDASLVALDRKTGELRWSRTTANPAEGYSFTMAPLAVAGKIVVGAGGGDFGARGFVDAYDAETGNRVWRFWTVPSPEEGGWWGRWTETTPHGESLHRNIRKEKRDSARYAEAWRRGGAAVWTTPAYDPVLGLVIFTTGNPAPVDGVTPPGDNLYSTSVVAVDVATGRLRWYYQMVPHNIWDYDAANPPVLLDLQRGGETLPLVAHAGKTGWVYLLDRRTGAPILRSEPLIPLANIFPPATRAGIRTSPGDRGGSNWAPSAYSPRTGLLYVQASDAPMVFAIDSAASATRPDNGELLAFARFEPAHPDSESGTVSAVDPATGRIQWQSRREDHLGSGGILVTAGGLVFFSEWDGHLTALDAESGETLWRYRLDDGALGSPIAFEVDGEQRIAVTSLPRGLTVFGLLH